MASNESFKQAIKAYLDKRAEEDSSWVKPGSVVTP